MGRPGINLLRIEQELSEAHLRLTRVHIENQLWQKFIERYDRDQTLFYLDPPYYKAPFYIHNLELADYQEMAQILARVKAKFILSINDHPDMRKTFKAFKIHPVKLNYTVSKDKQTVGKELLIRNF